MYTDPPSDQLMDEILPQTLIEQKVRPTLGPDMPVWRPPDGNSEDTEQ